MNKGTAVNGVSKVEFSKLQKVVNDIRANMRLFKVKILDIERGVGTLGDDDPQTTPVGS